MRAGVRCLGFLCVLAGAYGVSKKGRPSLEATRSTAPLVGIERATARRPPSFVNHGIRCACAAMTASESEGVTKKPRPRITKGRGEGEGGAQGREGMEGVKGGGEGRV